MPDPRALVTLTGTTLTVTDPGGETVKVTADPAEAVTALLGVLTEPHRCAVCGAMPGARAHRLRQHNWKPRPEGNLQ